LEQKITATLPVAVQESDSHPIDQQSDALLTVTPQNTVRDNVSGDKLQKVATAQKI